MILLCGIPSEPSLGMVIDAVRQLGAPHVVFHQRQFANSHMEFRIDGGEITGWITFGEEVYRLEDFTAVYTRLMDHRLLPEIENEPDGSPIRFHCGALHDALMRWYEIMPGLVLNRAAEVGVNYSKPYEAQLIHDHGFAVPETLITNNPEEVKAFRRQYGRVVYKSISYIRSIVRTLEDDDLDRLSAIRACPTQFQRYIAGTNVRVHAIGGRAIATAITSSATDYRYAYLEGEQEVLEATELSQDVERRCVELAQALRLGFAGIDLKITPEGDVYCLEVNPCPAFSYFQRGTGQAIAEAVASYLAAAAEASPYGRMECKL
jgi:glutathione synthase/RimK-type ligase-like ATP-grasp enzyme